jgi:hypothetical protein
MTCMVSRVASLWAKPDGLAYGIQRKISCAVHRFIVEDNGELACRLFSQNKPFLLNVLGQ